MDAHLLRIFVVVARNKSFTKASKKLQVSQTNVTLRIKQLEKNIEFKLFHRIPKGVVLTKEGENLLPKAIEIINKLDELSIQMQNIKVQNSLIIASTFSNASMRLFPFLKSINKDYPELKLELITDNTIPITKMLLEYKVDIGFINHEPINNDLMVLQKFENELLFVEPKIKCNKNAILAHEKNCAFYLGMKKYCDYIENFDYETIEIADFGVILSCVELGMGKTLLPKSIVEKFGFLGKLKLTAIDSKVVSIPTCLVCRKDYNPKQSLYLKQMNID